MGDGIMKFRMGELFCGPGGLGAATKGLVVQNNNSSFSIGHAWATDYDKDTCQTYRNNIAPGEKIVVCKDIRKLDFKVLKHISEIEALVFGFPCNDFSVVGKQEGINGSFGPLYSYGVRALNYFQPKWFLAENVGGLKNANEGGDLSLIIDDLYNEGYSVYPHLYKFEKYGVPQARHRIIIIGIHKDEDIVFRIPSPEPYSNIDTSCKNAIENPPIPDTTSNNELTKQSPVVIERLGYIKPGENVFTADLPAHLRLNVKGAKLSQIYKRLVADKPSYTITGSGGGGTHVYHWKEPRALTNRERARLQTFPDNFIFYGSKESVRKQIGMAVPPRGARIVFKSVLDSFAGIHYPFIIPNMIPKIQPVHSEKYGLLNAYE